VRASAAGAISSSTDTTTSDAPRHEVMRAP
jgi:hypothetical protein